MVSEVPENIWARYKDKANESDLNQNFRTL